MADKYNDPIRGTGFEESGYEIDAGKLKTQISQSPSFSPRLKGFLADSSKVESRDGVLSFIFLFKHIDEPTKNFVKAELGTDVKEQSVKIGDKEYPTATLSISADDLNAKLAANKKASPETQPAAATAEKKKLSPTTAALLGTASRIDIENGIATFVYLFKHVDPREKATVEKELNVIVKDESMTVGSKTYPADSISIPIDLLKEYSNPPKLPGDDNQGSQKADHQKNNGKHQSR